MVYAERAADNKTSWWTHTRRSWTRSAARHPQARAGNQLHRVSWDARRVRVTGQIIHFVTAALVHHFLVPVYRCRASSRPRIRVENDGEERSVPPSAHQEQQGRQERGEDGQGQRPHEGGGRRAYGRQEQEEGGPLGPEEGQGQGEEG